MKLVIALVFVCLACLLAMAHFSTEATKEFGRACADQGGITAYDGRQYQCLKAGPR